MHIPTTRLGRSLQLLTTPSAIFSSLIADIQRARESIDLEYYIFADDRTGRLFARLIGRKARQGLRVRLITDGYGSRAMPRALRRRLEADGVELSTHPLLGHSRYHRKMAVIDNRIAHVGGINIADRYVVGNNLGVWHDAQLRIVGGAVIAVVRLFDYDYMMSEGISCGQPMSSGRNSLRVVWSEASGGRAMVELLQQLVAETHTSLTFTTPYFMPPRRVVALLASAVRRGVDVSVIIPERCDIWILDDIIRHRILEAMRAGIDVRICRNAFVHAKLAISDNRRVVVGSANLDARSIYINRELMVQTSNAGVIAAAKEFINRLLALSTPPTSYDTRCHLPSLLSRPFEHLL